jgi:hypothetical protein
VIVVVVVVVIVVMVVVVVVMVVVLLLLWWWWWLLWLWLRWLLFLLLLLLGANVSGFSCAEIGGELNWVCPKLGSSSVFFLFNLIFRVMYCDFWAPLELDHL